MGVHKCECNIKLFVTTLGFFEKFSFNVLDSGHYGEGERIGLKGWSPEGASGQVRVGVG